MTDEAEINRLQQAVEADPADAETRLALLQLLVEAGALEGGRGSRRRPASGRIASRRGARPHGHRVRQGPALGRRRGAVPPGARTAARRPAHPVQPRHPAGAAGRCAGRHRAPREGRRTASGLGRGALRARHRPAAPRTLPRGHQRLRRSRRPAPLIPRSRVQSRQRLRHARARRQRHDGLLRTRLRRAGPTRRPSSSGPATRRRCTTWGWSTSA